jgi:hypothetical protein
MRFRCEVDSVEAVVVFRKHGIEDDNRNPTALQMMFHLSNVSGPPFRGYEETPVVSSRLKDHEVRLVGDGGIEPCEHAARGVEGSARIRYLHVIAFGPEHLLQNVRISVLRVDGPTRRIAGADGYNPEWIRPDGFRQEKQS